MPPFRLLLMPFLLILVLAGCALPLPIVAPAQPAAGPAGPTAPVVPESTDLAGRWDGTISIMGTQLRIIANFSREDGVLTGAMDIPQQGAAGIPLHDIAFEPPAVYFEMLTGPQMAVFDGALENGVIAGAFRQSGFEGSFELAAVEAPDEAEIPPADLPYSEEEVTFTHDDVTLAGTLTLPQGPGPHPALILVSGSGQQNRDEELPLAPGYRPFAVIADHLARQGIAVLRYDDRGVGSSTGDPSQATTADFAADAEAALAYLLDRTEIDPGQIGMLGHSEGGLIATMLASRNPNLAFIILMAGPGESGYEIILDQVLLLAEAGGATADELETMRTQQTQVLDAVRTDRGWDEVETLLRELIAEDLAQLPDEQQAQLGDLEQIVEGAVAQQMGTLRSPWYRFFITYDPAADLAQIDVPVLALYGGLDLQVPAESNQEALRAALEQAGNEDVTVVVIPEANHLFQAATTGSIDEYALLAPDFTPGFLDTITQWLLDRVE